MRGGQNNDIVEMRGVESEKGCLFLVRFIHQRFPSLSFISSTTDPIPLQHKYTDSLSLSLSLSNANTQTRCFHRSTIFPIFLPNHGFGSWNPQAVSLTSSFQLMLHAYLLAHLYSVPNAELHYPYSGIQSVADPRQPH